MGADPEFENLTAEEQTAVLEWLEDLANSESVEWDLDAEESHLQRMARRCRNHRRSG